MRAVICILGLVALLIATPAAPRASAERRHGAARILYRGKTAQKSAIQIAVSPGKITLIRFKARMLCRDGSLLFGDASDFEATRLRGGGRFSDVQHGITDTVIWKGRVKGVGVSGALRVKDRLKSGVRCDSGPVRFGAKRVGG